MQFNLEGICPPASMRARKPLRPFRIGDRVVTTKVCGGFGVVSGDKTKVYSFSVKEGSRGQIVGFDAAYSYARWLVVFDGLGFNTNRIDGYFNLSADELALEPPLAKV